MRPSDHPHSNHPASFLSPHAARDVRAEDEACAPDFATHLRETADVLPPLARHNAWPNRVHFRLGLVFCLGLLSTHPRGGAVTLGYAVVARFNWNWTFTVWLHGFINAQGGGPLIAFASCGPPGGRDEGRHSRPGGSGAWRNRRGRQGNPSSWTRMAALMSFARARPSGASRNISSGKNSLARPRALIHQNAPPVIGRRRPLRLAVRTSPFHGECTGSSPVEVATFQTAALPFRPEPS